MTTIVDSLLLRMGLLPRLSTTGSIPIQKKGMETVDALCNVPRYPPFLNGLPVHPPTTLLATQKELVDGVCRIISDTSLLDLHYMPAMEKLAAFVQLLPASQAHHHRGAGGMLRHSLEVGLWALQQTEGKLIRGVVTPQQRRLIEPRWRLAVFLAGLCHDLGKMVTDITVSDRDGTTRWRPYNQSLYAWAQGHRIENYFLHWQEGRGKKHTNVSSTLIGMVVGRETLDWISDGGSDALIWLTESLNNNPGSSNQVHHFVVKADQLSVERDLKSMGVAMAGYEIGIPIERYLTDIMRRLLREGLWRVNEPSARVWNIDGTTYLVWPMAGEEIANVARRDEIPGLPKTPDGILEMMVERELAFLRDSAEDPYFYISPDVVTEKIPDMRMKAIRLRDQALISTTPIPPVTGKIHNSKTGDAGAKDHIEGSQPMPSSETSASDVHSAPVAQPQRTCSQNTHSAPTAHLKTQVQPENACSASAENPAADPAQPQRTYSTPVGAVTKQNNSSTSTAQLKPEHPQHACKLGLDDLDGPMGEVLRVLVSEFRSGKKSLKELAVQQADGCVYLKWPHAFQGLGFSGKQILDGLAEAGWLIAASEMAKVGETAFPDGVAKSIKLAATVGHLFEADTTPPAVAPPAVDAVPPKTNRKPLQRPPGRAAANSKADMTATADAGGCLVRIHLSPPVRPLKRGGND